MTYSRKIIGLVGPSGAGKSAAGRRLIHAWHFHRVHAGIAVKLAIACGFGLRWPQVDGDEIEQPATELGGALPRMALEMVGEAIHKAAPDATSIFWQAEVNRLPAALDRILADGIRRPAEAEAVKRMGGIVVRITNPARPGSDAYPCDAMQAGVPHDFEIVNGGTLDDLRSAIDEIARKFLNEPA